MVNTSSLFLQIAFSAAMLIALVCLAIYLSFNGKNKNDSAYDDQLADLIDYDDLNKQPKVTLLTRWNGYWAKLFKEAGWAGYTDDNNTAGRDVLIGWAFISLILGLLLKNLVFGLFVAAVFVFIISSILRSTFRKKAEKINGQLPGFLFALKANVQANETPDRAILKVVDNMPSPLYEDLLIVKQRILANSTFSEALYELSTKTNSKDLKFLCACMIQAAASGANMENQITVIQKVLEDRRKVTDELNKAVRAATPSIWVASIVIPGVFVATMMMDPNSRKFWFSGFASWVCLGAVLVLYAVGVWASKKMVDNIRNL